MVQIVTTPSMVLLLATMYGCCGADEDVVDELVSELDGEEVAIVDSNTNERLEARTDETYPMDCDLYVWVTTNVYDGGLVGVYTQPEDANAHNARPLWAGTRPLLCSEEFMLENKDGVWEVKGVKISTYCSSVYGEDLRDKLTFTGDVVDTNSLYNDERDFVNERARDVIKDGVPKVRKELKHQQSYNSGRR